MPTPKDRRHMFATLMLAAGAVVGAALYLWLEVNGLR
jgi:hypothetical protein